MKAAWLTVEVLIEIVWSQPMLQELGKQNPALLRLINDNQAEFLRLLNEAGAEGEGWDALPFL